jgi:SAM-dependent methyltransferase
VIAKRRLPPEYLLWNKRWGAPNGNRSRRLLHRFSWGEAVSGAFPRLRGYFGFQENSATREAEYPWAFHATPLERGMRAIDLGGSLGGFQFVLDRCGLDVTNVDPGEEAHGLGWPVNRESIQRLNQAFGTRVKLENRFLQEARLPANHFDRVFSISTIEHIPSSELRSLMSEIYRILTPGGFAVLTIDLFLNTVPFTPRFSNDYGTNIDVKWLTEQAPFEIAMGDPMEIYGFPQFSAPNILAHLEDYLVGSYPAMAQLISLRKPIA